MKSLSLSSLAALAIVVLADKAAAQCPNGGCTPVPPPVTTFKGGSAKLPTVSSVAKDTMVIGGKTYSIDETARITVDGKKATFAEIKPGMRVLVSAKKVPGDVYRASSITARTNQAATESPSQRIATKK
jgi:hypothetical protein